MSRPVSARLDDINVRIARIEELLADTDGVFARLARRKS